MKRIIFMLCLVFARDIGQSATIDEMTLAPSSGKSYSPSVLQLPAEAYVYYLSDGSSWQSGAGVTYIISTTYKTAVFSNGFIYYDFAPVANGILYEQTDFDSGDHSAQGTLGWTGDVTLVAQAGSTNATFSGFATILDNTQTSYGQPRFNYYSAPVGKSVYFQMNFTINNATWQTNTFAKSFNYSISGYVDFTQVFPVTNSAAFPVLSISATTNGNWQVVRSRIQNVTRHETVCVLQSTTNNVQWTSVITNSSSFLPASVTNIVNATNGATFYRTYVAHQFVPP